MRNTRHGTIFHGCTVRGKISRMSAISATPRRTGRPPGRVSLKTPEVVEEIIHRISLGETLRAICESDHLPEVPTVIAWLNQDPALQLAYARARSIGYDMMAEQILDISDNTMEGTKTKTYENEKGSYTETTHADMTEHRKLMIDARKWLLAKLRPEKYGDSSGILSSLAQSTAAGGSSKLTIEFVRPGEAPPTAPVMKGLIEGTVEVVEEE